LKISFYTVRGDIREDNGFGYAGNSIRNSLQNLGHDVSLFDDQADVQLSFCHPTYYEPNHQYQIGYSPWESSALPEGWLEGFNSMDEVWTTSRKCQEWFHDAGVEKPIYVYEHGVDSIWTPKHRKPQQKIRFLHIGDPAPRKGGQLAFEAFIEAFGARQDVHLTIKANGHNTTRAYVPGQIRRGGPRNILGLPHQVYRNVTLIEDSLSLEELVALYHSHDVLVYPSWGEGFGLIPLQALATGMPTICTAEWASYDRFLGNLALDSHEVSSPWPDIHPGMMSEPDRHHLVELYRYSYENFDALSRTHFDNAEDVHSQYNWNELTKNAFTYLENKIK